MASWPNGWYAVSGDVAISGRISIGAKVNLILCDGASLNASKGIGLNYENRLTVWAGPEGTGRLTAREKGMNAVFAEDEPVYSWITFENLARSP